jgi:hypothetical protein
LVYVGAVHSFHRCFLWRQLFKASSQVEAESLHLSVTKLQVRARMISSTVL